jgi:predicted  nucleic acid-binding Zn-ribbon protein
MSHITTCLTCGKLYEEFSEESASALNERECGTRWMKREDHDGSERL